VVARKVGITHEQVIDTAARIADRDGLAAVSLAAVASGLGVRTPSLYAHVDGLDGLRRDLSRRANLRLGEQLQLAVDGHDDPVEALRGIAHAYRHFARKHPGQYAALLPAPRAEEDPEGAAIAAAAVQAVAAALARLDIEPVRHVDVIRTLRAMLHGFVDLENGHGFGLSEPVDASFETAIDLFLDALSARRGQATRH
jgi:AcrR family transcriptional regulator